MADNIDIKKILKALEASRQSRALQASATSTPTSNNLDVARYIMTNANVDWKKIAGQKDVAADRDTSGPSVISRIFDILSRPNYAVANFFNDALAPRGSMTLEESENKNLLSSAWEGFSGKDKTTFSTVIERAYNRKPEIDGSSVVNPVAKHGVGFLLDVLTDPLSLVGSGAVKGVAKSLGMGKGGEKLAQIPSQPQNLLINTLSNKGLRPVSDINAKPVNPGLVYKPDQLPLRATPPPNLTPIGGDPRNIPPKLTDVDVPWIKTSSQYEDQITKIDAVAKNQARRRFKVEAEEKLKNKFPEMSKDERMKKLNLWLMDNFPTTKSLKYKEISEGVVGPAPLDKPPVAVNAIKPATTIIDRIQKGDVTEIAQEQFNAAHKDEVLKALGNTGATEATRAQMIADQFIKDVLQPNVSGAKVVGNPAQQANLAQRIARFAKQTASKSPGHFNAFRMLRAAEDHLISKGYNPSYWDGSHIRMSDVIIEIAKDADDIPNVMKNHLTQVMKAYKEKNPTKTTDAIVRQAIENLRARNAIVDAPKVSKVIDEASKIAPMAEQVLSTPKYNEFLKKVSNEAKYSLEAQNASKSGVSAARTAINEILRANSGNTPLLATFTKRHYIHSYMKNGVRSSWHPVQIAQSKAIEEELGFTYDSASKQIGESNRAADAFMSRVATWWGQKDLRPDVLVKASTATANAAARARVWNEIAKKYTPDQLHEAFKVAQSKIPMGAVDDTIQSAAATFEKAMQNLFDSTGLTAEALKGSTVAMRSGMLRTDLNKQLEILKSPFRFDNGRFIDSQGNLKDYSQGTDWLKSWELAHVEEPLEFMFKLETAVEQLMHKYAFMDEIAARWGSSVRTPEFSETIQFAIGTAKESGRFAEGVTRATKKGERVTPRKKTPVANRLDGLYFPKEIVPQIHKALGSWDQIYNPRSELMRTIDRVTRAWKAGVTIYAPSHHIRNLIGDVYLSWMAGVNNPNAYLKARRILHSQKGRYKDLVSVEQLVGKQALNDALTKPGKVITHTKYGRPLTAEQIYIAAHSNGVLPHVSVIEELFGEPLFKGRLGKPANDFFGKRARSLSENREHFVRLAHFVDYIEKSKEKNLQKLFIDASKEVRRWHPDGSDLTDFERNVLRRILPFYSWTRKAIPLLVESAVLNPGKTVAYAKLMQALQGISGIEAPSRTDPFPYDQLFPDWIKEKGIGPIGRHGMDGLAGFASMFSRSIPGFDGNPSGYTVVNPSNPLIDTVAQFGGMGKLSDPLSGIGQLLHPGLKIPSEILHGRTFNDVPLEPGRYTAENIPILAMLSRLTNVGVFGPTERGQKEGLGNMEALINLLTAMGMQGTGPYIKTSEYQERDRRRAANG